MHLTHCLLHSRLKQVLKAVLNITVVYKEKSNKMQQYIKILLFHIYMKITCLGQHTAHYQEPKTALAASGFLYVEGRLDV